MIVAAVVCPHPPLLLRELTGATDAAADLRLACLDALGRVLEPTAPEAVVVVGGAEASGSWDPHLPVDVRRFGTTSARVAEGLPQSLGVARRLLDEAGWEGPVSMHAVAWDAGPGTVTTLARGVQQLQGRLVLLVMADGSARRSEKAPGHLDERAFAFDDEIGRALEEGDAEALTGLDPVLAEELMVQGRAAFAVLGAVTAARGSLPKAQVTYRDDPFGVMYTVATWDLAQVGSQG